MPNIDLSLSTRLGSITESRLLSQRKTTTAETFFTAKVLLGQIRQYPRMMIEGKRLPPFIHPKCASGNWSAYSCASEEKHVCLPEVLAVCANLVHMFYGRTPASSRFVWETIYKHQKKLHNEHLLYRSADLLDALQATVIYLLLQAEDPESVEVNDTLSLIDTISDVAKRYRMLSDYQSEFSNPYTVDRKTWIETESVRRTVNLLWIIELDLNVIIGPPRKIERCGGYSSVPLPCDKWLWDPTVSDAEWTKRYRQSLGKQKPMLCIGDLRFSRQSAAGDGGEVKEGLTEWCEGLEEFGALIWMAGMLERSNS
ncbi:hypothetical protein GE09DRAFT_1225496 [Coniochaeta sp. 2T2.1]|nr:hypothetical protein GE09DRAFT_1225496 [Coniochaeta sp. 2T2.1]